MPQKKLVSIYLNSEGYRIRGKKAPDQCHGIVQEHLTEYLQDRWKVATLSAGTGASGDSCSTTSGWVFFVLLEKQK
jgi:hypothetical protein